MKTVVCLFVRLFVALFARACVQVAPSALMDTVLALLVDCVLTPLLSCPLLLALLDLQPAIIILHVGAIWRARAFSTYGFF